MPAALDVEWSAIAAQAAAGATLEELSAHWGIPVGTLKSRCATEGWKRMAREIQAQRTGGEVVAPGHSTIQPRSTDKAVTLMATLGSRSRLRAARVGDKTLRGLNRLTPERLIDKASAYKAAVDGLKVVHEWGAEGKSPQALVNINLLGVSPDTVGL